MPPSYGLPSKKGSPLGSEFLTFAPERHRVDSEQFGGPFHADAEPEHSPDVFRFQLTQGQDMRLLIRTGPPPIPGAQRGRQIRPRHFTPGGEQRALRKLMASNEKKIETLKGKIEKKQLEMAAADQSDYLVLTAMQEEIADFEAQIESLELEWFEAAEKLGE